MIVTYKEVSRLTFPVYLLPSSNWQTIDGLLYLDGLLVDDRNMPGKTLGTRRLQTPFEELLPLKKCIESYVGIIKQTENTFIDSKGVPFLYQKTKYCKLKDYKIRRVDLKDRASILWLEGINNSFIIPRPPKPEFKWASILHYEEAPWLLYSYSIEKAPDTRRKI